MKNTKITTKYIGIIAILIAAVLSIASPAMADQVYDVGNYDNSYDVGNYDNSYDVGNYDNSNSGTSYDTYDTYTYTVSSGGNNTTTYDPYYYNYNSNVSSGGYYVPAYNPNPIPAPLQPVDRSVTTGGFYGGNTYVAPTTYYVPNQTTVSSGGYTIPNQVLAYTDTNPTLDSVYLSDVPYTGFADNMKVALFISALVIFSSVLAYLFLKRKEQIAYASVSGVKNSKSDMRDNFTSQMTSDTKDIVSVEEYARMKKVLLSSDASAKIVKLSRLGKINASSFIGSLATGEWVAVGEKDIEVK